MLHIYRYEIYIHLFRYINNFIYQALFSSMYNGLRTGLSTIKLLLHIVQILHNLQ